MLLCFLHQTTIVGIDEGNFEKVVAILDGQPLVQIPHAGELLREHGADEVGDVLVFQHLNADRSEIYFDPLPASEKPT